MKRRKFAGTIPPKPRVKPRPVAKAKAKRRIASRNAHLKSRAWLGIDLSLHALAIAGIGYDDVLKKNVGPSFHIVQWHKEDDYFKRLRQLSLVQNEIALVLYDLKLFIDLDQIHIAQEEPWPLGLVGKGHAQTLKQQAEMSGALLAGLLRYGYPNIYQIHNAWWRKIVADDLGITTHHSKWGKGVVGKMRCKQWALSPHCVDLSYFPNEIPVWPDLIADSKNGGRMSQPENSRAKPLQPDDRYQALPMAVWMMREEQS